MKINLISLTYCKLTIIIIGTLVVYFTIIIYLFICFVLVELASK